MAFARLPHSRALLCALFATGVASAQQPSLPGNGLARRDFLYAGEAMTRDAYIVRGGKVAWEFHDEQAGGEISDIQLASNGQLVIAHQFGVKVINQGKATLWSYPGGKAVWTLTPEDVKSWNYTGMQVAQRLPNGNTLVNHWVNQWSAPNLGPSTILQLLDRAERPEDVRFGTIR